ncbi:uncharacterized protein RMCN_0638 [Mycolicibacterium novocastrense]|uniref:Uncharacterized protein n=1 Tax=Mycolicibacterium novocastrense TaxID=59813 RepID=A0ABQ0KD94_MYCNV|nr:uncharacterized protein RMCN_0638 [Mycolicibacterium novocastrense]
MLGRVGGRVEYPLAAVEHEVDRSDRTLGCRQLWALPTRVLARNPGDVGAKARQERGGGRAGDAIADLQNGDAGQDIRRRGTFLAHRARSFPRLLNN